jgi:hypothetical protein
MALVLPSEVAVVSGIQNERLTHEVALAMRNASSATPIAMRGDDGVEYILLTTERYRRLVAEGPTLQEAFSSLKVEGLHPIPDEVWDQVFNSRRLIAEIGSDRS